MANCGACMKSIKSNAYKLSCADCQLFFHGMCVKMSKVDVETLTAEGLVWRCSACASVRRRSMRLETQAEQGSLTLDDIMKAIDAMREDHKRIITEFNTSYEVLNSQLELNTAALKEQTTTMSTYMDKMQELMLENKKLKENVAALEFRLEEAEQYSRRNCVEIHGIPEERNENTEEVVKKVGEALGLTIEPLDIDICHRLGKKDNQRESRGIIVKFVRRTTKEELMRKRREKHQLSTRHLNLGTDHPIYINESLSPARRKLFAMARKVKLDKGYKFAWHRGGRIFLRKS